MIRVPKFATEIEEANWWYDNREEHAERFLKAAAEGRVRRGGMMRYMAEIQKARAFVIDPDYAKKAARVALHRDVEVLSLLDEILNRAIQREFKLLD